MTKFTSGIIVGVCLVWIGHSLFQINVDKPKPSPQYSYAHLSGSSMEQYGYYDGMIIKLLHDEPRVGDAVSFKCLKEVCPKHSLFKILKKQDENCYWFQGRDDEWLVDGRKVHSLDSRSFGWVCKNDILIDGVVRNETHNTKTQMLVCK